MAAAALRAAAAMHLVLHAPPFARTAPRCSPRAMDRNRYHQYI